MATRTQRFVALSAALVPLFMSHAITSIAHAMPTTAPAALAVTPAFDLSPDTSIRIDGPIATQINGVIQNWLLKVPDANPAILTMLRNRDSAPRMDLLPWSGEFAGKYLTSGSEVLRLTGDATLKSRLERFVTQLIACQDKTGYIGPFSKKYQLTGKGQNFPDGGSWDVWGNYHIMLGLLTWYDVTSDQKALAAAKRMGDLMCTTFLDANKPVSSTGSTEMNQAIVHSLALLHERTGEKKYLDLAEAIVKDFATPGAGDYLNNALSGKEFFQSPKPRWESLHPIMGLAELYWITNNTQYRDAFEKTWWSIVKLDRHDNGGFSSGEQAHGDPYHRGAIETCCTVAWIATSVEMLRMTGDPRVADELELSTLNQVRALHAPDGSWCTYNTPMEGARIPSMHDIGFQIRPGSEQLNCCSVNAARGFGMIADWAIQQTSDGAIAVNWYGPSTANAHVGETAVQIKQTTTYPNDGHIDFTIEPVKQTKFALKLRVPHWSAKTKITVNGEAIDAKPGTYATIDREWKSGDKVSIDLDFSPRFWTGERDYANRSAVYRGPILLAMDVKGVEPTYSDEWRGFGNIHPTDRKGAWAEFGFTGTSVKWLGKGYDDAGMARVLIDGKEVAIVDQFAAGRDLPFSWEKADLADGPHTLRLEVTGQKSKQSRGTWINIDGFEPRWTPTAVSPKAVTEALAKAPAGDLLFDVKDEKGGTLELRPYSDVGQKRQTYTTWLEIAGLKPLEFSVENPSRTMRAAE